MSSILKVNKIQPFSGTVVEIVASTLSTNGVSISTINVTASGDISASGTIHANTFKSTGGDVNGITFVDHTSITGNVTASGMISASGTVIGQSLYIGADGNGRITETSDNITIKNNVNNKYIEIGGVGGGSNLTALTLDFAKKSIAGGAGFNITGSGDISASGKLSIGDTTLLEGDTTITSPNKLYLGSLSGLHVYSEGTNADQNQIILAKTNDLKIMNQSHGKSIIFSTETEAGASQTPLTLTNSHITASGNILAQGNISASGTLTINGETTLKGDTTILKGKKLYFDSPSGLHVYSEGTATDENQIILAKTNNLRIINQAHGKDILFQTENAAGTVKSPLSLLGDGQAVFGGNVTASNAKFDGEVSSSSAFKVGNSIIAAVKNASSNTLDLGDPAVATKIRGANVVWVDSALLTTAAVTSSTAVSASSFIQGSNYITKTQTVAAAGSNQGDATAIVATAGTVFVSTDSDAKGVRLPAIAGSTSGSAYTLYNTSGEEMKVYPASGDRIFPLSDNANATLPDNASMTVTSFSADGWQGFIGTVIS